MINDENKFENKRKPIVPPQGVRCQKCLEYGHWSYECKGQRKYLHRSSRTQQLRKRIKLVEERVAALKNNPQKKARKASDKENSSSSDSSSDSSSSDSDSSSSDSDSNSANK